MERGEQRQEREMKGMREIKKGQILKEKVFSSSQRWKGCKGLLSVQLINDISKGKCNRSGKIMSQNTRALLIIHFIALCLVFKIVNPCLNLHFDRIKKTDFFYL